ncbi:holin [Streptomyces sp. NBC_01304]|uniref:holin n=1 Tax=Streptomyces sp. NBC_01304 TaxID=2903818 RepID=UPI002E0DEEDF|nr:holin [Streptomyces sp. NBC_01304]
MWTAAFWKDTAERAVRTFAQALVAVLTAGATNLLDVDWVAALSTAGMATLLAVLTAIGLSARKAAEPQPAGGATTGGAVNP